MVAMLALALALSAGVASPEKSETPTLDRLRALINDQRFKEMTYDSGLAQAKVFQDVLESLVPELKELDVFYRQGLTGKLRIWLEKNKKGVPDGHAMGLACVPAQDFLIQKYRASAK